MNKYFFLKKIPGKGFWTLLSLFVIFSLCCTDKGNSENITDSGQYKKRTLMPESIKNGDIVNCVKLYERKMKSTGEHFKNEVTIQGVVVKIELPEIHIKVSNAFSSNFKMEKSHWVQDKSVVKRPPYNIGKVYVFKSKHDVISNVVYEGMNQINFELP